MIVLDDRVGSKELARFIPGAKIRRLDFGDIWFQGRGENGQPVAIGIERKTISDLVNSMVSGRLAGHQIPGMLDNYDYSYLLVEGYWRPHPKEGYLEVMRRGWQPYGQGGRKNYRADAVSNFLNTISIMTPVTVYKTLSEKESCQWIKSIYKWWNNKKFEEHRSHLGWRDPQVASFIEPTLMEKMCSCFAGVGEKKAKSLATLYPAPYAFSNHADVDSLLEAEGIGKVLAQRILDQVWGMERE